MNKIICSHWDPITYASAEFYLDNGEKIVMKHQELRELPQSVISVEGNEYSIIADKEYILGFRLIKSLD